MNQEKIEHIPSEEECIALLKKVGCSGKVICHCKKVRDVAMAIAQRTNANKKLVEAGALLHDIGRSQTHKLDHAIAGRRVAERLGLPESIICIIERHIGAGLNPKTAQSLGLPFKDYRPKTIEEKIVCHADNLVDDCSRQNIEIEIEQALFDGKKDYAKHLVQLHKEISDLIGMDANDV